MRRGPVSVWTVLRPPQGELEVELAGAGRRLRDAGVHVREDLQALGLHLLLYSKDRQCMQNKIKLMSLDGLILQALIPFAILGVLVCVHLP